MDECELGCTGDDKAVHYGWFRCTRESRAILAEERKKLAAEEEKVLITERIAEVLRHEIPQLGPAWEDADNVAARLVAELGLH